MNAWSGGTLGGEKLGAQDEPDELGGEVMVVPGSVHNI